MKNLFLLFGLSLTVITQAQNYLHQTLILNEGYFDYQTNEIIEPVTIGSYNPASQTYQIVDTLEGMRFASDMIINGPYYYVAADSKIFKMDLNTHQEIASVELAGVRNLGVYQDKLIATRGEYLVTFDSYLHVYNSNTLDFLASIDTTIGPKYATQNIVIDGSVAYIAVNNGFEWGNEKGFIGTFDLTTLTYGNEVNLGPDGKNPDNLVKLGNFLYTVNNKDFSGSSISKVALDGTSNSTVNLANVSTGCGTSSLRDDKLVYQLSSADVLNEFDINVMNNIGPVAGHTLNYYELAQEPVSGQFYTSETDYFSFGKVHIFDANNTELSNFNVGISPGTIVFDVRPSLGINQLENTLLVYPNPVNDLLYLSDFSSGLNRILDLSGKEVISTFEKIINVSNLQNGAYFLENNGKNYKFLKN